MLEPVNTQMPLRPIPRALRLSRQPQRVMMLMTIFGLSLRQVCDSAGRSISRSQLHRILHGQRPTPAERQAIANGIIACMQRRCDSAFLFEE
jgi:hypothetical protein